MAFYELVFQLAMIDETQICFIDAADMQTSDSARK